MPEENGSAEGASQSAPSESLASSSTADSAANESVNGDQTAKAPTLSRYERTKRERAAFRAEREQFLRERDAFIRERTQAQAEKNQPKYNLQELEEAREAWAKEADWDANKADLVKRADKEIAKIKAAQKAERQTIDLPVRGTAEHTRIWHESEADIAKSDPDFMQPGTALDIKVRQILNGPRGGMYLDHAYGAYALHDAAKRELAEEAKKTLQAQLKQKEEELKKYQGYTSIDGGSLSGVGNGSRVNNIRDFEKLSLKDMRQHLTRRADNKYDESWF